MKNKENRLLNCIIVLVVVLFVIFSLYLFSPPEPAGKDASLSSFSAQRAMSHIKEICRKPHFIGTEENRRVREYLAGETKKLGLLTEIQNAASFHQFRGGLIAARVHNVIAVLKGTDSSKAVMLIGHYDSTPHTPGAADDGSAVAAMLEIARALTHTPPLQNDIIFLFTDGEEVGLMGAKAFADKHPLMKDVGVIFNLEARGNRGTAVTFEVSSENGWLMKEYAQAVPYPFAASVMYEVYKQLPNDTDFTIFKQAGYSGFNAAFIDGFVNYHSPTDTPAILDLRSLQHHGSTGLGMARHFGRLTIGNTKARDVVFFNPIGHWLVIYPGWLHLPLVILVFLLFLVYLVPGAKKKEFTVKGVTAGFFIYLIGLVLICVLGWLTLSGIKSLYPHYSHFYSHNFYNVHFYFYVLAGLTVGLFSMFYFFFFSRLKTENLRAGSLILLLILMVALYLWLSTAAYLLIFPLLFILGASLLARLFGFSEENRYTGYALLHLLAVLPALALYVPMIKMLWVTFSLRLGFVSALLMVILLGFLLPQIKAAFAVNKFALPVLAFLIAAAAFLGGHLTSVPSPERPLQSSTIYCLDADNQKALWVSRYLEPDDWNRTFFTRARTEPLREIYPERNRAYLKNDAPPASLPLPEVQVLEESVETGKRDLHLTLLPSTPGSSMILYFHKSAGIDGLMIDGQPIEKEYSGIYTPGKSDYHTLVYYAVPAGGIDFVIQCREKQKLQLVVLNWKLGLPLLPGFVYPPMPAHIIPDKEYSHLTLVKKTFLF